MNHIVQEEAHRISQWGFLQVIVYALFDSLLEILGRKIFQKGFMTKPESAILIPFKETASLRRMLPSISELIGPESVVPLDPNTLQTSASNPSDMKAGLGLI